MPVMPPLLLKRWQAKHPPAANILRPVSKLRFFIPFRAAWLNSSSFHSFTYSRPAIASDMTSRGDFTTGLRARTSLSSARSCGLRLAMASFWMNSMNLAKLAPPR